MGAVVSGQSSPVKQEKLFIGGGWSDPATDRVIEVHSPSDERLIGVVPEATTADVDAAVRAARVAFDQGPWKDLDVQERVAGLRRLAALFTERRGDLARLQTAEAGLPIAKWSEPGVDSAIATLTSFADLASEYEWETIRQGMVVPFMVRREPVGVVAAILPWNSPVGLTMWKVAPALLAGCSVIYKPAPETPLHSYLYAEIFEQADLPAGVFNIVPGGRETGQALVEHPGVDKVSFTGSTAAGKKIASLCGSQLKRVSLELGGKSASIVLDDADLSVQAPLIAVFGMMNNGEACVNQTRVLAPRSRYSEVAEALRAAVEAMSQGDPEDPATDFGPLIAERQRDRVEGLLDSARAEGGKVILGGGRPADMPSGWWVEPTVMVDVENDMRIAREEIFGPVLTVIPYDSLDEGVAIANDTPYGLSGSVWTAEPERGLAVARRIRTGHFGVNTWTMDPLQPFGGFKESGIGREQGPEGLDEFVEIKSINLPEGWLPDVAGG